MHLKKIELHGFKSFADKTQIDLEEGITTIVGPNGSGKSNISDAIRWVLGEQSMKMLRGEKPTDLVFSGTQIRRSLGFAQATLIFDNQDKTLPIEFDEVKIARRIYRTGESSIFINDVQVRLKDVTELFLDTGIGKDGYSIIGQGRVEKIISNKSEDRRHIFDEAAGIAKYRYRKEESEKKLEKANMNLLRIKDITSEIEQNLEPLKDAKEKATKYLELQKDIRLLDTNIIKISLGKLKSEQVVIENEISDNDDIKQSNLSKIDGIKFNLKDLKIKLNEIQEEIEKIATENFEFKNDIEKLRASKRINDNNIENINKNSLDIEELISQENKLANENELEIEEKTNKKNTYLQNKEKYENELKDLEKKYFSLQKELSFVKIQKANLKDEIDGIKDEIYDDNISVNNLEYNVSNLKDSIKNMNEQKVQNIQKLEKIQLGNEDLLRDFNNLESKILSFENEIDTLKKELEQKKKKQDNLSILNKEQKSSLDMICANLKLLKENEEENDGYSYAVKELLGKQDILDTVGKIISVDEKYLSAIDIALGNKVLNVIVQDKQIAKRYIEYLKQNKIGRATFYPLDDLSYKELDISKIKDCKGFIATADNLVKVDDKYKGLIKYLLNSYVIVDTLDNGILISNKFKNLKIITLNGDFLASDGSMTGGFKKYNKNSILNRQNEIKKLERKVFELKSKKEEQEEQLNLLERQISNIQETIEEKKLNKEKINIEYVKQKEQNKFILTQIEQIKNGNIKLEKQIIDKQKALDSQLQKLELLQEELKQKQNKKDELLKSFEEFDEDEKDVIVSNLKEEISDVKISLSSILESQDSIDEIITRIQKEKTLHLKKVAKYMQDIEKNNVKINEFKENNLKIDEQIMGLQNLNIKEIEKQKVLIEQKKELNINVNLYEENISKLKDEIEIINDKNLKNENRKYKISQTIDNLMQTLWFDYELTPNNIVEIIDIPNIQQAKAIVNEKKEQLKSLGSVNINAIEEYKELNTRYEFLEKQKQDLEQTIQTLKSLIIQITKTMKKTFSENFDKINQNFQIVFSELFGGGKAYLELEDKENVLESQIEIKAQPPGKKLASMSLLSGGEKALTAICILFAILKINPSPFCVLDEIEAALDDVNVYRFSNYLQSYCKSTQFIIITHRKGTMQIAKNVYGVTMEEKGISKLLSLKL